MTPETPSSNRRLQQRLGRVGSQPVAVGSHTNKRVTVNYRAPVGDVARLLPEPFEPDEIGDTDESMVSMCACDFHVTRFGPVPVPSVHTNEMLCRVSATLQHDGRRKRAYYTLRSDTSSRLLGLLGGRFSHFRKATSRFDRRDDGEVYALTCDAEDPLCGGSLTVDLDGVSKRPPESTVFDDAAAAAEYVLELDGSCGHDFDSGDVSFQNIEYPDWDVSFCRDLEYEFPLLEHLFDAFDVDATFDCALYMADVDQTWGSAWLQAPEAVPGSTVDVSPAGAGD